MLYTDGLALRAFTVFFKNLEFHCIFIYILMQELYGIFSCDPELVLVKLRMTL